MAKLETAQENQTKLREAYAAAAAKAEGAETQLDDAKAEARKEGEGRAKLQARLELVQAENEKLRADAVARSEYKDRAAEVPRRRRWLPWRRRHG